MSAKKTITDDDMALFRDAVGEVRSVNNDKVTHDSIRPSATISSAQRDDESVMDALLSDLSENDLLETGEHLSFTQPGVQRSVLRKLKSGRYASQATIDLHGLNLKQAKSELSAFLKHAQTHRHLCITIIHGKGRREVNQGPKLKPAVNQWLRNNSQVLAFCSARASDGGTGAVYVLLKRGN
ncbi:MAG: Smr/MutS family protein [Gammaproteobacteria bacterium]|nr:Smr/MutS family protein [Gammaproteobacteria bacterium]